MTGYTAEELGEGWEFKIVRSAMRGFARPDALRQMLDEEALTGYSSVARRAARSSRLSW